MQTASIKRPAAFRCIEWGVSSRPIAGESELGDGCIVAPYENGTLAAVIDGLGHGPEAAEAARAAITTLEQHLTAPVLDLVQYSHKALQKTRGAVLSIASFDALNNTMTWIGVGNVAGVLFRANDGMLPLKESLLLRSGVVGYQLPPLRATTFSIFPRDTLIFATDGIRDGFHERLALDQTPQEIAAAILANYGKKTDDALALVVRYMGLPA